MPRVRVVRTPRRANWPAATPAMAAALLAGLCVLLAASQDDAGLRARYERDADVALAARDYETARVCFERLLQMSPNDDPSRRGLALCLSATRGRE